MAWHTVTCKCKENKQGGGSTDTFVDGINIIHKGVSDGDQYTVQLSRNDNQTLSTAFTVPGGNDTDTRVGGYGTAVHATEHNKASVLKVSADTAITNVSKGNYRAELDAFLLEKFKFGSEYTFSSYSAKRNEIVYEHS